MFYVLFLINLQGLAGVSCDCNGCGDRELDRSGRRGTN